MKKIILILLLITPILCVAQKKELQKAIKKGNSNGYYVATFKKNYSEYRIKNWLDQNGYVSTSMKRGSIQRYGDMETAITKVIFISKSEYWAREERKREKKRKKSKARKKETVKIDKIDVAKGAAAAALLYFGYKSGKWVLEESLKGGSSNGKSGNTTYLRTERLSWEDSGVFGRYDKTLKFRVYCGDTYLGTEEIYYSKGVSKPFKTVEVFTSSFKSESQAINDVIQTLYKNKCL